jgi:hypothetical protein
MIIAEYNKFTEEDKNSLIKESAELIIEELLNSKEFVISFEEVRDKNGDFDKEVVITYKSKTRLTQ